MGLVKSEWIEVQERGWSAPDTFVCADCVEDPYLKQLINSAACSTACSYCGRSSDVDIAAESEVVIGTVYETIGTYYVEPASGGVPISGGFVVPTIDVQEVLMQVGFDGHQDFVEAVIDAEVNGNSFVPAANGHWAGIHPHEVLSSGWNLFAHAVKHETRFHFTNAPRSQSSSPYEIEIADVLPAVAESLRPLIRTLPAETEVYRSRFRQHGQMWEPDANQLGPPPKEIASAGRMNPAGIPYFYTATDLATARHEIGVTDRNDGTVFTAIFKLQESVHVIDLTLLPPVPSIFDLANKGALERALFVREFVETISRPVVKDGREHIDYVPSQVVCEYLAQIFKLEDGSKLGGLVYPSAVHPDGKNLVVFPREGLIKRLKYSQPRV